MEKIGPHRSIVWTSFFVFCVAFVFIGIASRTTKADAIVIETEGQPTLGYEKATVHLVSFEEPKCPSCKEFTTEVFPKIKEEYIDTKKVRYTLIPVSFLPGSMPAAVALLGVYHNDEGFPNSDLYFTYFDYMYAHQPDEDTNWATVSLLTNYARNASKEIHIDKLKSCIEKGTYRIDIEKNTNYGKQLMGGSISTPTLYINGVKVEDLSYENVSKLIKEALGKAGVY